jgi:predicted nucleic acid-binding protein
MGEALILDTSFLIDLEREHSRGRPGRALAFLEEHEEARYYITFTTTGELAAGKSLANRDVWETFLAPFYVLPSTPEIAWEYGRAFRHLEKNRQMIGANDLWIAATALANGMPVVTADTAHFERVPGLDVREY